MDPIHRIIELALEEDAVHDDVTTRLIIPPDSRAVGKIFAKEQLVVAGNAAAAEAFRITDATLLYEVDVRDGEDAAPGTLVAAVAGSASSILRAERTALNFLQRMSGIATNVRRLTAELGGSPLVLLDTRKTAPGMRFFDKYAVRTGGGRNHRSTLADGILIKDNHVRVCGSVREAVRRARGNRPHLLRIEVEVQNLEELKEALDAGADVILLDNMANDEIREAARLTAGRAELEVSGGVGPDRLRALAEAGVQYVSIGSLTHSVKAVDLSLELYPL